jgi:hypothetical protein
MAAFLTPGVGNLFMTLDPTVLLSSAALERMAKQQSQHNSAYPTREDEQFRKMGDGR